MTTKTNSRQKATEAEFEAAAQKVIEIGRRLPPKAKSQTDKKFDLAMKKAMRLDRDLEPVQRAIYRRVYDALQNPNDRELFEMYSVLHMGSVISKYAPRHLVATDLTFGDYIKLYTTWAKKAEKLLKATEPRKAPVRSSTTRKTQNKAARMTGRR